MDEKAGKKPSKIKVDPKSIGGSLFGLDQTGELPTVRVKGVICHRMEGGQSGRPKKVRDNEHRGDDAPKTNP